MDHSIRLFLRRLIVGAPPLLPAYLLAGSIVFLMNTFTHLSPGEETLVSLSATFGGYCLNTALASRFLKYFKKLGYYREQDWQGRPQTLLVPPVVLSDDAEKH